MTDAPSPNEDSARLSTLKLEKHTRGWYKRPFDLVVLILAHAVLLPFWILLWSVVPLGIWLMNRGPIFYTQERLGKNGRLFRVIKFRTMIVDAEASTGPVWAADRDWRIFKGGWLLRRFRIDELPQVINIFKGEMSLVGPRPERPELAEEFRKHITGFDKRLRTRPGIAGLAQVRGHYSTRPVNKLRYDNLYITRMTPFLDVKLLFQSLLVAIRGHSGPRSRG